MYHLIRWYQHGFSVRNLLLRQLTFYDYLHNENLKKKTPCIIQLGKWYPGTYIEEKPKGKSCRPRSSYIVGRKRIRPGIQSATRPNMRRKRRSAQGRDTTCLSVMTSSLLSSSLMFRTAVVVPGPPNSYNSSMTTGLTFSLVSALAAFIAFNTKTTEYKEGGDNSLDARADNNWLLVERPYSLVHQRMTLYEVQREVRKRPRIVGTLARSGVWHLRPRYW
ncbi:hypothetical protein AGLY_015780 [Aphis glycines]|uniref:Uncharacterized protein n=1 Tax=Aphis glycines TaxID=307491 RepID=A0A6G0T057_APHGL|nr:hypothetical protein AGLY_015780 [Aphis glycines]